MVDLVVPAGVPSKGYASLMYVPAIAAANTGGAPTVAELTGAGVVRLEYLIPGTVPQLQTTREKVPQDRACLIDSLEAWGKGQTTLSRALDYIYDPQNPEDEASKAYAALTEGTTGFLVWRNGLPSRVTDPAADQIVSYAPVSFGPQNTAEPAENEDWHVTQDVIITAPPTRDVKVTSA